MTGNWVGMVITLLERGEERLVSAVETGLIPVSFAIDILRRMTSIRQIEAAALMVGQGNFTALFAKALLVATPEKPTG